ncbi:MAG: hypothetical protein JWO78_515 [Micavibrio sp.]|nr:hypothetical protein [Micavibrio sp.]
MRIIIVFLAVLIIRADIATAGDVSVRGEDPLQTGEITPEKPESVAKVQIPTMKDDNPDASGLLRDNRQFLALPSDADMPEGSNQVGNYEDPQPIGFNDPSAAVQEKTISAGPKRIHINQTN